jgi:tetratricopeptide (TPR) repeat protein
MSFFGWFRGKPKIEGELGYFELADWWLSTFSEAEREYIEKIYEPMSIPSREKPLTKGRISYTSKTAVGLLSGLAGWFRKPQDRSIAKRVLAKAEELGENTGDVLDLHFMYLGMIQSAYKARESDPAALDAAIDACEKQIANAPRAAKAFKREYPTAPLPAHTGYTQLAIIREKQKDYREAIRLASQAKKQGWNDDWDKRIERCKAKLQKEEQRG